MIKFKKSKFRYNGKLPIIEVEGMFKIYINRFNGRKTFSLAIDVLESSLDFAQLEKRLAKLASKQLSCKPRLIKEDRRGRGKVYCKVLTNSYE